MMWKPLHELPPPYLLPSLPHWLLPSQNVAQMSSLPILLFPASFLINFKPCSHNTFAMGPFLDTQFQLAMPYLISNPSLSYFFLSNIITIK